MGIMFQSHPLYAQIEPPPPPSTAASIRAAAESRLESAKVLEERGDAESLKKAIEDFRIGLESFRLLDDSVKVAETLMHLGEACYKTADYPAMTRYYSESLDYYKKLKDQRGQVNALYNVGISVVNQSKPMEALSFLQRALDMSRKLRDQGLQAGVLDAICQAYTEMDDYESAALFGQEALSIRKARDDTIQILISLQNLAQVYDDKGENQKALDSFLEALQLARKVGQRQNEAVLLGQIGHVYLDSGQQDMALDYFQQCLDLSRKVGHKMGEAYAIKLMGDIYRNMGDYSSALRNYALSQDMCQQLGIQIGVAATKSNLAMVYLAMNNTDKALALLNEALEIDKRINAPEGSGKVLDKMGDVYTHLGDFDKAIEHYEKALFIANEIRDPALFQLTWFSLGRAQRRAGQFETAQQSIEKAIQLADSLRGDLFNPNLRSSYFASIHNYYDELILLLMQRHEQDPEASFDNEALNISEQSRCRSLLEMLNEGHVDLRASVNPALRQREAEVMREINAKERKRQALSSRDADTTGLAQIQTDIRNLLYEKEALQDRILRENPRFAAVQKAEVLSAHEIQNTIVDDSTVLIEYALIDERSFAWVISKENVACIQLPAAGDIEKAVRSVYFKLIARNKAFSDDSLAQRRSQIQEADEQLYTAMNELSAMILAPLAKHLNKPRLVFIADGILQYIPLGALPLPAVESGGQSYIPLVQKYRVLNLPSASTAALIREQRRRKKRPDKRIAIFADPVFSADDPRIKSKPFTRQKGEAPSPADNLNAALQESGLANTRSDLSRLPFSRMEAQAIASLLSPQEVHCYTDFNAAYSQATSAELSKFKIIHFATHGIMNSEHPELSGLVLSLYDEKGEPQNGFLRLHDIYNLDLNADLVVLSACQTALGKNVRGEGLIGLTRGFMYAGAPRVVASLWKVDDEATAALMKAFYGNMLQKEMPPDEALQQAQLSIRRQKRWQSPYYWAAFVMQGDWQE